MYPRSRSVPVVFFLRMINSCHRDLFSTRRNQTLVVKYPCVHMLQFLFVSDNRIFSWGGSKHGRLGYETTSDSYTPCEVEIDEAGVNIQSLSVAHNTTMLAGQGTCNIF